MEHIIFKKAQNDFYRWSDGEIFVTSDEKEIASQYQQELFAGNKPEIFHLKNVKFFDADEMKEHHTVFVEDESKKTIGVFTYISDANENDDLLDALDEWAKDYMGRQKVETINDDKCFNIDKGILLEAAKKICIESGVGAADEVVLCDELFRACVDYLNWADEKVV